MFCKYCGNKLLENPDVCTACGKFVNEIPNATFTSTSANQPISISKYAKLIKILSIINLTLSAVFAVVFLIMLFTVFNFPVIISAFGMVTNFIFAAISIFKRRNIKINIATFCIVFACFILSILIFFITMIFGISIMY